MRKNTNPMARLIDSGVEGVHSATRSLTKAFCLLVYQVVNGKQTDFQHRMELWLSRTYPNASPREKSSVKGNVSGALAEDKISWSTFMKGLDILGFNKAYVKMVLLKRNSNNGGVYTTNKMYKGILNGEEYKRGDILVYAVGYEFDTHKVVYELWVNKTTNIIMRPIIIDSNIKEITDTHDVDLLIPDISKEYSKYSNSDD